MPGEPGHIESVAGHRATKWLVALGIGVALALLAFHMATDPRTAAQRAEEEATVRAAREILARYVGAAALEIVDPLAPKRAIGKSYIYPAGNGYEVSGHYRRGQADRWHPFLMRLDGERRLVELSVRDDDAALLRRAASDPKLTAQADRDE